MRNEKNNRLIEKIKRELGKLSLEALADPNVIEIMLNEDGTLWKEEFGKPMEKIGTISEPNAKALLGTIASYLDTTITIQNPIIECELPIDGSRFEGLLAPIVNLPSFTIRKKASKVFTLDEYEEQGVFDSLDYDYSKTDNFIPDNLSKKEIIKYAVKNKKNILLVGSTGSGKTTLANAIIHEISTISPNDRLVIIEDTAEIQCSSPNKMILKSNNLVSLERLLEVTLRLRPDRILVGEVRYGSAALALLKAWNTGHPGGAATIHADSAYLGLRRLESIISEVTANPQPDLIAEAVDLVIFITKTKQGRVVPEIIEVRGYDSLKQEFKIKTFA